MKRLVLATAMLLPAYAGLATGAGIQSVVDDLKAQGYSDVEVSAPHGGKITVDAHRQGVERDLVYDASTGRLLSDESHGAGTPHAADHGGTNAGHDATDHSAAGTDHAAGPGGTSAGHGSDDQGSSHDAGDHNGTSSGHDTSDHKGGDD